ncbi:MAG: hypothetical protein FJ207_14690 [Gemmatimonadetes bacterium]|nr:hypothetical protein [Gemmatimonadota bacterium]
MAAPALPLRQLSHRVIAALMALAYALPLAGGAVANMGHGAFHVIERLQERQAQAAALGLVHLGERASFTHTHDGVTHSHAGAVDALLVAAEQADEQTEAAPATVKLSVHTPASAVQVTILLAVTSFVRAIDASLPVHPLPLPPVPPPRA